VGIEGYALSFSQSTTFGYNSHPEWGEVLGDEVMAAALIDRILHYCHIVNIRANSLRMRQHSELWKPLQEQGSEQTPRRTRLRRNAREVQSSLGSPPGAECSIFVRR
jgi:IstB-like ATP binding protein